MRHVIGADWVNTAATLDVEACELGRVILQRGRLARSRVRELIVRGDCNSCVIESCAIHSADAIGALGSVEMRRNRLTGVVTVAEIDCLLEENTLDGCVLRLGCGRITLRRNNIVNWSVPVSFLDCRERAPEVVIDYNWWGTPECPEELTRLPAGVTTGVCAPAPHPIDTD
jgi:hypothetical protein